MSNRFVHSMGKTIKHIILICSLLLFGNNLLFANASAESVFSNILIQTPTKFEFKEKETNNQSYAKSPVKEYDLKRTLIAEIEEENIEFSSVKKSLDKKVSYNISSFYLQSTTSFLNIFNDSLQFCKGFFYLPAFSSLYILLRVFRI